MYIINMQSNCSSYELYMLMESIIHANSFTVVGYKNTNIK